MKKIHKMVESVKQEAEVSLAYMRIGKSEAELIRQGKREGIKGYISLAQEFNMDHKTIIDKLMKEYNLCEDEAKQYLKIYVEKEKYHQERMHGSS